MDPHLAENAAGSEVPENAADPEDLNKNAADSEVPENAADPEDLKKNAAGSEVPKMRPTPKTSRKMRLTSRSQKMWPRLMSVPSMSEQLQLDDGSRTTSPLIPAPLDPSSTRTTCPSTRWYHRRVSGAANTLWVLEAKECRISARRLPRS